MTVNEFVQLIIETLKFFIAMFLKCWEIEILRVLFIILFVVFILRIIKQIIKFIKSRKRI